ncbi:MAG: hypothetical protein RLY93_06550 [Sumerlaeia bacterium]
MTRFLGVLPSLGSIRSYGYDLWAWWTTGTDSEMIFGFPGSEWSGFWGGGNRQPSPVYRWDDVAFDNPDRLPHDLQWLVGEEHRPRAEWMEEKYASLYNTMNVKPALLTPPGNIQTPEQKWQFYRWQYFHTKSHTERN